MEAFPKPDHAFGVDPSRRNFYSLRQARYDALARDISELAGAAAAERQPLSVLDVGCGAGVFLRHIEVKANFANIVISGADLQEKHVYRRDAYQDFFVGDLTAGYPEIPSDAYDVVICEQILEHLPQIDTAIATLERVLRPGGRLFVGVPIFLPPLHLARKYLVPVLDRVVARKKPRSHLHAFTCASFLARMRRHSRLRLLRVRGFRIISGGLLQPLEDHRWWWRLNCRVGELVPFACIEIQAIMEKPATPAPAREH
jgi:2-polyprenyl-3-methyl-5-hydroxy-6-metoxy-1,4-benzoquinol methylase